MIKIIDKNKIIYFTKETDANNYKDYMINGLKVIRITGKTYHFNNGDRLTDVTFNNPSKKYVLVTRCNRRITSGKLQKKHITAIKKEGIKWNII